MDWGRWLIWLVSAGVVLGTKQETKIIWCLDDNAREQSNLVKDIDTNDILCQAQKTSEYPWTTEAENTPPRPISMQVNFRKYKTTTKNASRQIAINVSWRYRKDYFLQYVKSYHIEMNFLRPPGTVKQYLIKWNESLPLALRNTAAKFVEFRFIYSSRPGNYHIKPRDRYRFKVQACPIYDEDSKPQSIAENIEIPDCNNKNISKTESCVCPNGRKKNGKCRRKQGRPARRPAKKNTKEPVKVGPTTPAAEREVFTAAKLSENPLYVSLIAFGCIIIVLFIVFAVIAWRRTKQAGYCIRNKSREARARRHVLLVVSADDRFSQPVNQLITAFYKSNCIDVACNLREKVEIGQRGILKWTTKSVNSADFIVFVVANAYETTAESENGENGGSEGVEGLQVAMALKVVESLIASKAADANKKLVAVDLNNCIERDAMPLFKIYKLPVDFKKFLKSVFGDEHHQISDTDKTIFLNLLSNAQLGYCMKVRSNDDSDDEKQEQKCILEGQNDLDLSPHPSLTNATDEGYADSLNITSEGPPSCESHQSQAYVTTDFNDDRSQMERYRQSGARPKVV